MEIRAAETRLSDGSAAGLALQPRAESRPNVSRTGTSVTARRKAVSRVVALSKPQEYAFIRGDMRRLLFTAGSLLAIMIVLLFILER